MSKDYKVASSNPANIVVIKDKDYKRHLTNLTHALSVRQSKCKIYFQLIKKLAIVGSVQICLNWCQLKSTLLGHSCSILQKRSLSTPEVYHGSDPTIANFTKLL